MADWLGQQALGTSFNGLTLGFWGAVGRYPDDTSGRMGGGCAAVAGAKVPGTFRIKAAFHVMTDQTNFDNRPAPRRGLSAIFLLLGIIIGAGAVAIAGPLIFPAPPPPPAAQATVPSEITQAIRDLQAGQQKAADQLQTIQQGLQGLASGQADTKQLSGQVAAVSDKLEALRQSFASQQASPPAEPASEPVPRRRGKR